MSRLHRSILEEQSSGDPLRRVIAFACALVITLVSLIAFPASSSAAQNSGIVVGPVTLSPNDAQLTVGDSVTVSGGWDATEANPQPGDTFTIGLPAEFAFPQAIPFALTGVDASGAQVVWGTCLTDPDTGVATCELSDVVTSMPELVKGTWQFDVEAVQATTANEVTFELNNVPVVVPLPGGGGIDDGIELPGDVSKSGVMNQNNWSMTWRVELPGANMAGQKTVTIHDTLGAGHQLCAPTGLKVETVRGSVVVDVTDLVTTTPSPGATDFTLVLTAPESGFDKNVTYRVTYQTCTPDGQIDPPGTEYANSAEVEGWGSDGIGVGQVQNLPWQQELTKSGRVLGGADRNGEIAWTVTVPGDQLVGKDGFTFTETLGDGHQLCADTISDIQITERYGPSNQLQQDITHLLRATTVSSQVDAFQVRFDIDDADFSFRASDYRYVITYTTCVTADDLPAAGTGYTNTVDVDGHVATEQATVPARAQGKSGRINTSSVEIDGVAHMPQTTLDWTITIPGQTIEDVDDLLTLTDTLSASQAVCAAGDPSGGLAERLRVRVEARDQIQGGGLATVDLTDATDVTVDGNDIRFAIEAIDLPIPTGTSDGFSREYQYVLTYTTCTTSGGMDAPGTEYSNAVTGSGINFTSSTTQHNSGSGTGQGVTRGSVSVDKLLADTPGAVFVPDDETFTVHIKEIDPSGTTQKEYDLQVPLNGDPVKGLNARGRGWTVELSEPTLPTVPGVSFGAPAFSPAPGVSVSADGETATVAIDPGANVSVTLTNTALLGSLSLVKALDGGAADHVDPDRTFQVTAAVDTTGLGANVPAQPDRILDLHVGDPVMLEDLPIGATVTFTEVRPTDDDILTWAEPVFTPRSIVVSPAHVSSPATITVTNSAARTTGTFSIVKMVTGDQADSAAVPDAVTVTATWDEEGIPGTETLTVPTDGTPVPLGHRLLVGTQVTLTETPLTDGDAIAWRAPVWSGEGVTVDGASAVVTVGRNADATVRLDNHAATSTAGITLIKGVAGEAAAEIDPATTFPVTVAWTDGDGIPQSRELTINSVEPTPLGETLPAGTIVTITEGTRPGVDTVVWGSVTISGERVSDNGDGSATVTVSDQQGDVNLITVVNEATWAPGTFTVSKRVEGILPDHTGVPASVTVVATWTDESGEQTADLTVPTDGSVIPFPKELPHGTRVTLSEANLDPATQFTWGSPSWAGDGVTTTDEGLAVVTIGAATTVDVELVNTAVASLGSFTIVKSLTGDGAEQSLTQTFPVALSWTDLMGKVQTRTVEVAAGSPVTIDGIPLGTPVRVEELASALADRVRWAGATWSTSDENTELVTEHGSPEATVIVAGEAGSAVELELENSLVLEPDLATTGADGIIVLVVGAVAAALIAAGLVLLQRARRRTV